MIAVTWWILLGCIVVGVDQWTKDLAVSHIQFGEQIPVIPGFFNLTLTYNLGAAFGIFSGVHDGIRPWILFGATLLAFAVVFHYMRSPQGQTAVARFAFTLILGGAVGNLIDRIRLGKVIDFLDVYVGSYHWPAFNLADSCICVGVILLLFAPNESREPESEAQTSRG
ncbi:MAG: signal peptidase II [Proteobacteria bacterium]|nr:signal peptidase II [Pseudomonadota bacterium]